MKKVTENDYVKAVKRADREFEIEEYGKIISFKPSKVHKSKKTYSRKGNKKINPYEY